MKEVTCWNSFKNKKRKLFSSNYFNGTIHIYALSWKKVLLMNVHIFSRKEEIAHAVTHGIGALLSIVALILLVVYASISGGAELIVSVTIFGTSMLFMYLSSTIVHSLRDGKWKNI